MLRKVGLGGYDLPEASGPVPNDKRWQIGERSCLKSFLDTVPNIKLVKNKIHTYQGMHLCRRSMDILCIYRDLRV